MTRRAQIWVPRILHTTFSKLPGLSRILPISPQSTLADLCCLIKVYSTQKVRSLKSRGNIFCEITNGSNVSSSKWKIQILNFIVVSSTKFEIQIFYLQNVSWAKLFKMQNWNIIFSNWILSEIILNARFKSCICKYLDDEKLGRKQLKSLRLQFAICWVAAWLAGRTILQQMMMNNELRW